MLLPVFPFSLKPSFPVGSIVSCYNISRKGTIGNFRLFQGKITDNYEEGRIYKMNSSRNVSKDSIVIIEVEEVFEISSPNSYFKVDYLDLPISNELNASGESITPLSRAITAGDIIEWSVDCLRTGGQAKKLKKSCFKFNSFVLIKPNNVFGNLLKSKLVEVNIFEKDSERGTSSVQFHHNNLIAEGKLVEVPTIDSDGNEWVGIIIENQLPMKCILQYLRSTDKDKLKENVPNAVKDFLLASPIGDEECRRSNIFDPSIYNSSAAISCERTLIMWPLNCIVYKTALPSNTSHSRSLTISTKQHPRN